MHRAIANTYAIQRAKELTGRQCIRDDLGEIYAGMARVIAGRLVWRHGVDLYVLPVSLNARHTQATFTLAKICYLAGEHGLAEAERLVSERDALQGIEMMGGLPVLSIVDTLTRFSPAAFTYPVTRIGCTWHFYKDGFDLMPSEGQRSAFSDFLSSDAPRAGSTSMYGLLGATGINEQVIWQMLREGVNGINRLFAYIGDFRNFLQDDGTVDFVHQLKAFGAVRMLVADLSSMCATVDPHSRITFTLGFLDKMANLIAGMRRLGWNQEGAIALGLASKSRGEHVRHLFSKNIGGIHDKFAGAMLPAIDRCFSAINEEMGRQFETDATERQCLERLRDLRNMSHGTFLRQERFERLFLSGKGELPEGLVSLPHLLTWGLLASPEEFIMFDPEIDG
jgi:hypothetical protein